MKNLKNLIPLFLIILIAPVSSAAQETGEIRGMVTDLKSGVTLPGAAISYQLLGVLQGAITDTAGQYKIKPLEPGTYDLTFSFTGYQRVIKKSILVTGGSITYADVALDNDNALPEIEITWTEPLIRKDDFGGTTKILPADIKYGIRTDIQSMVANSAGGFQKEEGGSINIRGSRDNATQYIVDGIRMSGNINIPRSAIREITVISGGVPAMYGDATGGIVIITTKSGFNR